MLLEEYLDYFKKSQRLVVTPSHIPLDKEAIICVLAARVNTE